MTDGNGTQRKIGEHDADIRVLKEDLAEVKDDVKSILEIVNKQKGAWKAFTLLSTISGGIAGLVISYLGLGR